MATAAFGPFGQPSLPFRATPLTLRTIVFDAVDPDHSTRCAGSARGGGAAAYLVKPFRGTALLETVNAVSGLATDHDEDSSRPPTSSDSPGGCGSSDLIANSEIT
jgi:hypothetical protein